MCIVVLHTLCVDLISCFANLAIHIVLLLIRDARFTSGSADVPLCTKQSLSQGLVLQCLCKTGHIRQIL